MATFKYDVVALMELMESKPCIWDKTHEFYKNKNMRDKNWQEIFSFLEDRYENLSPVEKKKIGEHIMTKWANIRDAFLRSLKKARNDRSYKRCYVYAEHLQFLLKLGYPKDDTDSHFGQARTEDGSTEEEDSKLPITHSLYQPKSTPHALSALQCNFSQVGPEEDSTDPLYNSSTWPDNRTRSKRPLDDIEREIRTELKKEKHSDQPCSSAHYRSDHEMLLLSFVPYIRDMSETELMDFQMEALTTIKRIKQQRVSTQHTLQP